MHVLHVVGARPQFVKLAPVSAAVRRHGHRERILHTGQHFDDAMSRVFFRELDIGEPHIDLGVHSLPHGAMTGRMLEGIERVLLDERPDVVLVYGDTDSTLAATLAAVKLGVPCAHVEAGLRSFNRAMPEELNRVAADHLADLLLAPPVLLVAVGRLGELKAKARFGLEFYGRGEVAERYLQNVQVFAMHWREEVRTDKTVSHTDFGCRPGLT